MTELLTAAQMRAIEAAAIASGEVTGLELMERAGRGVVEAIFEEWPELRATSHRAVVLCGPGNNGGDGFVVARLLKEWGWEVEVFLYGDPDRMPPDARVNYERWAGMGEVLPLTSTFEPTSDEKIGLIVDALFGIGLSRPIRALGLTLLGIQEARAIGAISAPEHRNGVAARVVSIDLPSGICGDSGRVLKMQESRGIDEGVAAAPSASADLTVTFHAPKVGHVLDEGSTLCGKLIVKSIGLERQEWKGTHQTESLCEIVEGERRYCSSLSKRRWGGSAHKYSHGHALILSGPPGHTGATRLAARAALRIGAGLVTVGATPEAIPEHAAQLNAIMLRPVVDSAALEALIADDRINALCIGPALGLGDDARSLLATILKSRRATVVDADALTLLAREPALFAMLHARCILTPHGGEFARLFPDIAEKLAAPATKGPAYSKVDATREAAARAGCVVLYKGPDTVIADPSGRCAINSAHYDRAAPWLATAGSGDVLAGFIAGLLARGFAPMRAAETAAWLHVECARKFGPGLIAEDLPEQLPAVFRDLGLL